MDNAEAVIIDATPDRPVSCVDALLKRICPCLNQSTQSYHVQDARITRELIQGQPELRSYSPETRIVRFSHSKSTHPNQTNQTQQSIPNRSTMRRTTESYTSPGHIALSWSSCSGPLPKFQKQYPKLKLWILEISMQPAFYYLAFCIANHFILPKSTRKQVNDPNWQKNFNNLWIGQYLKIK